MADKNIQMTQRNATNDGWDNLYPKTKAANVVAADGTTTFQTHLADNTAHGVNTKMPLAGGTFTGAVNHGRNEVQQPKLKDYSETVSTIATATGAVTLNIANGNVFNATLTGATTFTFSNPAASGQACSFTLVLNQGATAYAVTWPSSVSWDSDSIPDISTASKTSIIVFTTFNGGTRWYGRLGMGGLTT